MGLSWSAISYALILGVQMNNTDSQTLFLYLKVLENKDDHFNI